jgi:hypothetical protein
VVPSRVQRDDLPLVGEVSRQAWTWIHENQQSERAESRKAKASA